MMTDEFKQFLLKHNLDEDHYVFEEEKLEQLYREGDDFAGAVLCEINTTEFRKKFPKCPEGHLEELLLKEAQFWLSPRYTSLSLYFLSKGTDEGVAKAMKYHLASLDDYLSGRNKNYDGHSETDHEISRIYATRLIGQNNLEGAKQIFERFNKDKNYFSYITAEDFSGLLFANGGTIKRLSPYTARCIYLENPISNQKRLAITKWMMGELTGVTLEVAELLDNSNQTMYAQIENKLLLYALSNGEIDTLPNANQLKKFDPDRDISILYLWAVGEISLLHAIEYFENKAVSPLKSDNHRILLDLVLLAKTRKINDRFSVLLCDHFRVKYPHPTCIFSAILLKKIQHYKAG